MKNIILASASPRRKELLTQIGVEFSIEVSNGEEITSKSEPSEVVKELSYQKAKEVFDKHKDSVIIGADTIVSIDGQILGKPGSIDKWREMIVLIQGKSHSVFTGVTLLWTDVDGNEKQYTFAEETRVYIHAMSDEEIDEYISRGESMDKAGGYGIQNSFARFVDKIEGDYSNVVGLPVARVYQALKLVD